MMPPFFAISLGEALRGLAFVELVGAVLRNPLERLRQLRLHQLQLRDHPPVFTGINVGRAQAILQTLRLANRDPRPWIRHQRLGRSCLAGVAVAIAIHAQVRVEMFFRGLLYAVFYIGHVARGHAVLGMNNRLPRRHKASVAVITAVDRDKINLSRADGKRNAVACGTELFPFRFTTMSPVFAAGPS